jgi:MEDS: MEthanogen/methylotroph, DcmR Sensory domain
MVLRAEIPDLGFQTGDHVCAFYNGSSDSLDDIVVDYVAKGLQAGYKCFAMVDQPAAVRGRISPDLVARDGMLNVLTEDEAYMPDGHFSKDAFVGAMKKMVTEALADGYQSFRAVGDESFIVRNAVDVNDWFAAEAELNEIVPGYPHFFFCLYDLELFDGDAVMYVLRTHPRIYVNGMVITNPHYTPADQLPG